MTSAEFSNLLVAAGADITKVNPAIFQLVVDNFRTAAYNEGWQAALAKAEQDRLSKMWDH